MNVCFQSVQKDLRHQAWCSTQDLFSIRTDCTMFNVLQLSMLKDQLFMVVSHFFISVWIKCTSLKELHNP